MFKLSFNFNEPRPIYTCKGYAYIKKIVLLSEESFVTFDFVPVLLHFFINFHIFFTEQYTVYHRKFQRKLYAILKNAN